MGPAILGGDTPGAFELPLRASELGRTVAVSRVRRAIRAAIEALLPERDLVNRVLRVWLDRTTVFEQIPPIG